ncbi:MAG: hypothetical protein RIF36_01845 [Imperialibacter sp.]
MEVRRRETEDRSQETEVGNRKPARLQAELEKNIEKPKKEVII